jgi:hypothetical protein
MQSCEAGWTVQPAWRKASFCASTECLEVAQGNDLILIRDSVLPHGAVLQSAPGDWRALVSRVKAGELDSLGS